ncbi:MAG: helix-turn-helix domain-containing protein [Chloroflexi bacterium]|nr:helix-turn-helix domain-containing protein [Chloroflexota bacterium]
MVAEVESEWLTQPEAATLLRISIVTLHRWIKQGRLPAYRVGPRKVRIRRLDLAKVLTPAFEGEAHTVNEAMPMSAPLTIRPLTDEEVQRGLKALEEARALGERILARTKGKQLSSSVPIIRKDREERSRRLLGP